MAIIRLRAGQACRRCGATLSLPHRSEQDCLNAINAEIDDVLSRTRAVRLEEARRLEKRATLLKTRLAALRKRVARMDIKSLATGKPRRHRSA
jgi:hypothetical protein